MAYSIKEIASLACVSTRTIRYYDEIGLLLPSFTSKNGYRYYDHRSLLILQQILFFRRLEMPLKEIASILEMPTFNPVEMLQIHRQTLQKELQHTRKLITTIDNTISMIKGDIKMVEKALFNGFDEEKFTQEAEERWGGTEKFKQSKKRWKSYSEDEKAAIKKEGRAITIRMVGVDSNAKPEDGEVQKAVDEYLVYLNKYFYTCDAEFLRSLSEMWVADPRFAVNFEWVREGGAEFVHEAVEIYCRVLK